MRLLPEVVDFTIVTNIAGASALGTTMVGAALGCDPDRLGRLTLLGTVVGGAVGVLVFLILLVRDVL